MKPFRMFTALLLVPRRAQDPVPGLCYQVKLVGPAGTARRRGKRQRTAHRNKTCKVTTCDSTYFTYFTYFYNTLQYKSHAPHDTRTPIQNKSPAKSQTNYAAPAAHCAIYARTAVGWAGAAVGAEPPDTTLTQQITQQ